MIIRRLSANFQGVEDINAELYGVEIEVEAVRTLPEDWEQSRWNIVADGSLRNRGQEFISQPSTYEQLEEMIPQFYRWNSMFGYESNIRTSTHVHVNVLDFDTVELAAALTAYAIVEPLLFRVCGEEREQNIYCVPWYRGIQETRCVRRLESGSGSFGSRACKYSALYMEPIERFGTVEFRHAPVFPDADTFMFWLGLCKSVIHNGKLFETGEEVMSAFDALGPDGFADRLFGSQLNAQLKGYCEKSYEDIIDEAASHFVAECCVTSCYTYNMANDWTTGIAVTGDRQEGYHRVVAPETTPMYEPGEDFTHEVDEGEDPGYYDEDGEQY